jgi:ribonuclease Y
MAITQEILVDAMTSAATDFVGEYTTSMFPVGGEEIKGKIIGKEGRNIKTFEKITGVELIMDESDEYVLISCFDPLRRELAKITLTKLLKDGRIHPARIEEFVQKARLDLAKQIIKDGEEIAFKAGFPGLTLEHLKYLGRMKYRYSYGQCLATHVLEVVNMAGKIAGELGLNIQLAKECALWHDIGKVITHEKEGDHMELGEEIGRKLKLKEEVINAMYAHHMAKDPICMESAIIYIADANSGARPGARYGKDEDYVKRIKALEDIAKRSDLVRDAYAIDAGREVRVFVDPVITNDDAIIVLSNDIAKEIQDTQTYPGTVKVTVIREVRATSMAK